MSPLGGFENKVRVAISRSSLVFTFVISLIYANTHTHTHTQGLDDLVIKEFESSVGDNLPASYRTRAEKGHRK